MIHIKEENYYIGTTRFNNSTFNENQMWREKHSHKGCIYGFGVTMSVKIPINSNVFVIEMNNNKNKIKGIGLIKNHFYNDQKYNIYNDQNYNRFIYKGSFRISREKIVELCGNFIDTLEKRALVVGLSKEGWKTSRTMLKERQQLRDTIGMLINKNPDFQILAERVLLPLFQERTDFLEDLQYDYDTLNEYGVYLPNLPGTEDI